MSRSNDEALARLEHKLDVTLDLLMELIGRVGRIRMSVPKMGDDQHACPICRENVRYIVDMQDRSVAAQCGCKTGKYAPLDLEQFAPPRAAGGKDAEVRDEGDATSDRNTSRERFHGPTSARPRRG